MLSSSVKFCGDRNLLVWCQQRELPDLAWVNFDSSIAIVGGHITFQAVGMKGEELAGARSGRVPDSCRMRVLPFQEIINNVKYYRLNDHFWSCFVQNDFFPGKNTSSAAYEDQG